jgi:hypothetical protein
MLLKQLSNFLEKRVNQELSAKMRLSLESATLEYFKKREEIEERVILTTNWLAYFVENIHEPEFEEPSTLDDSDLLTAHKVLIEALKRFIDSHQESDPTCTYILTVYRKFKTELEKRFPDYPKGDGFLDYLEARTEREGKSDARRTGEFCIHCGSKNVRSNGDKWQCDDCKKQFRKR